MKKKYPSRFFTRFFRWFCHPALRDSIEGDLIELYHENEKNRGHHRANLKFIVDVLLLFRPGIIKPLSGYEQLNNYGMLKSYFVIASRIILRKKFHSAINVFGLTIAIAFALLIGAFVYSELQVNKELKDVDRLYLLESKFKAGQENFEWFTPSPLTKEVVLQYPTVFENYYRFFDRNVTVSKGDKHFRIQSMIGDSTLLNVFGFKVIHGNSSTALSKPGSIVMTEKMALQYFGKTDVVGETVSVSTEQRGLKEFEITAVIKGPGRKNSVTDFMNMDAQFFFSMENVSDFLLQVDINSWASGSICYIKLRPGVPAVEAQNILNDFFKDKASTEQAKRIDVALNPLENFYLFANQKAVFKLILSLLIITVFILLLAVVNFINISIASSFARLKEVGVRKVIGGLKQQVVIQFLCESLLLSIFSGTIALLVYQLLYRYFGTVLRSPLMSLTEFKSSFWIAIAGGVMLIGLFAGLYPAIYLSATRTIDSLKGKTKSMKGTIRFSRGLIATQFALTTIIFTAAIVLSRQVSFFMEKDLGYERSRVLVVTSVPRQWSPEGFEKMKTAKQEFLRSSKIKSASLSWGSPGSNLSPVDARMYVSSKTLDDGIRTSISATDEDYLSLYEIKLIDGKYLMADGPDRIPNQIVINQAAQKALGIQTGDKIKIENFGDTEYTVAGIMGDFNFESLHQQVKPVAFMHNVDMGIYRYFSFKLQDVNLIESVQEVERLWKQVFPDDAFSYFFADERLKELYTTELQLKDGSTIATVLMILIVLTGVLGLVSLSVSKRTKEIGIRKVLGASVTNILGLISREYAVLVLVAFLAGAPVAYWFANNWLQTFAFHIEVAWWMFAVPLTSVFIFTIVVVVLHSLTAALSNPVKSLRAE